MIKLLRSQGNSCTKTLSEKKRPFDDSSKDALTWSREQSIRSPQRLPKTLILNAQNELLDQVAKKKSHVEFRLNRHKITPFPVT